LAQQEVAEVVDVVEQPIVGRAVEAHAKLQSNGANNVDGQNDVGAVCSPGLRPALGPSIQTRSKSAMSGGKSQPIYDCPSSAQCA
jgi:hypothetical protein